MALRTASQTQLQPEHYQNLQVCHIPRASSLIQCYFCLHWIVNCPVVNPSSAAAAAKSPPTIGGHNLTSSRGMPSFTDFSMRHPASPYNMSMSFGHGTFAATAMSVPAIAPTADAPTLTLAELFFRGEQSAMLTEHCRLLMNVGTCLYGILSYAVYKYRFGVCASIILLRILSASPAHSSSYTTHTPLIHSIL